jgi:RNA polymerase-binding transcription factor DksA
MNINKLKQKLEKEKMSLEKELKSFANKDKKLKDDWDARFPNFNNNSVNLENEAAETEEYATLLPIEHALEVKLKNINLALEKIENNKYGKCEKCNKEIEEKLLEAQPETKLCLKCKN